MTAERQQVFGKIYRGDPSKDLRYSVTVYNDAGINSKKSRRLKLRLDIRNHSPTGFNWGYMGSGPGQLSLALLADVTGDDKLAQRYYLQFKQEVIARLEHEKPWEISEH